MGEGAGHNAYSSAKPDANRLIGQRIALVLDQRDQRRDGDGVPRARIAILAKDLRLAIEMAQAAGVAVPLGEQALAVFQQAVAAGRGDADDAAILASLGGIGRY